MIIIMQASEFRSAFGNADLIADLLASQDGKNLPTCPFGGRKSDKMKIIQNFAVYLLNMEPG